MAEAPALAVVDFSQIPVGLAATDALVKASPIAWLRSGTVSRGRFLAFFGGTPAAVEVALEHCLARAGAAALDHVLLADAHPQLVAGLRHQRQLAGDGALAILETGTATATVRAAERALKTAPVTLVEVRLAEDELDGKGLSLFRGELHDVEAAMEAALAVLGPGRAEAQLEVIPAPHEAVSGQIAATTRYASAPVLELPGEGD